MFGLSFLAPLFLGGAAAAAVPIVLHLLRREPEPRVKFAAVRLLKQAPVEHTERRRLRELLLLALRVAALLLLAFAFARPFLADGQAAGARGVTLVALDTSYSMSAPGAFERARQSARDAIGRARAGDEVGVLTFSDAAAMVSKPSMDRRAAAAAVDSIEPGFGSTRYRAGLSAAAQALEGRQGTVVVVTDLQEAGWDAGDRVTMPESARIEIADVGAPVENLAIVAAADTGSRLAASIRNSGTRARDAHVRLQVDGRAAGDATVPVGAGQTVEVALANPGGVEAAFIVEDGDGWQADNVRYLVTDKAERGAVLIVTGTGDVDRDAFYAEHALTASAGAGRGLAVQGVGAGQLSTWTSEALSRHPVVVVLSTLGLDHRGREALSGYLRAGGGVLVAAGPDVDGEVLADLAGPGSPLHIVTAGDRREPAGSRALAPADARHPIFRAFGATAAALGLVKFRTISGIGGTGCQPLARFTTGETALLDCAAGDGRLVIVASDLNNRWNDFPLHPSFVPFLHETVRYLSAGRHDELEYVIADVPAGVPPTPGLVSIADERGRPPRRVAVNVDPRESDSARMSAEEFRSAVTRLKDAPAGGVSVEARQQEDRQHLWQYILGVMIAALAVEGLVASRTA